MGKRNETEHRHGRRTAACREEAGRARHTRDVGAPASRLRRPAVPRAPSTGPIIV